MKNPTKGFNIGALNASLKDAQKGRNPIFSTIENSWLIPFQEITIEKPALTPVEFSHHKGFHNLLKASKNIWGLFYLINNRIN